MFDFVRFGAKPFMRLSKTTPPNIAGTPSLLAAIRGPEAIDVPRLKQSPMRFSETSRHAVVRRWRLYLLVVRSSHEDLPHLQRGLALVEPPSRPHHLVLNFRDPAPPSPRDVLANATPRRFPLRLITRNLSSGM